MNIKVLRRLALLSVLFHPTQALTAQERPLSLAEALTEAKAGGLDVRVARAQARAAREGVTAAAAFRWPTLGLEAGAVRSDDPVAAFGGRLRQGRFTEADFDPARLNHPDALTDWSGAVGAVWAPLDFSAEASLRAASREANAAELGSEWAARAAEFRAEARYLEAVGAERRLQAADAAWLAAEENARMVELRRGEGMLTDADAMQARAAAEGARARRIQVERSVADTRERLAVAMGWPEGVTPIPTDTVFELRAPSPSGPVESRTDLLASGESVLAAEARVAQARRARLPVVQGFVRLETHSADAFSGVEEDWTVGFQIRVPLFTGFAVTARERAATAMREAAERTHDLRVREAQAELAEARRAVETAELALGAATSAADAAAEAARLMRRRFEEGLTTTADLLSVEAQAAELTAQAVNARLGLHLMVARLAFLTDTNHDDLDRGLNR
jgi:outer membrane protein TolC